MCVSTLTFLQLSEHWFKGYVPFDLGCGAEHTVCRLQRQTARNYLLIVKYRDQILTLFWAQAEKYNKKTQRRKKVKKSSSGSGKEQERSSHGNLYLHPLQIHCRHIFQCFCPKPDILIQNHVQVSHPSFILDICHPDSGITKSCSRIIPNQLPKSEHILLPRHAQQINSLSRPAQWAGTPVLRYYMQNKLHGLELISHGTLNLCVRGGGGSGFLDMS